MTVSEISDKILDEGFGLDIAHSEEPVLTPSEYFIDSREEGLDHHGVLGMKWGVRRTPEELGHKIVRTKKKDKRYEGETERQYQARMKRESAERIAKTEAKAKLKSQKAELKSQEKQQRMILKSQEKQRKAELESQRRIQAQSPNNKKTESNLDKGKKRQDVKSMTDQEIRDAIARMQLENQYKQMSRGKSDKMKDAAKSVLGNAAKTLATKYTVMYADKGINYLIKKAKKHHGGGSNDETPPLPSGSSS